MTTFPSGYPYCIDGMLGEHGGSTRCRLIEMRLKGSRWPITKHHRFDTKHSCHGLRFLTPPPCPRRPPWAIPGPKVFAIRNAISQIYAEEPVAGAAASGDGRGGADHLVVG